MRYEDSWWKMSLNIALKTGQMLIRKKIYELSNESGM